MKHILTPIVMMLILLWCIPSHAVRFGETDITGLVDVYLGERASTLSSDYDGPYEADDPIPSYMDVDVYFMDEGFSTDVGSTQLYVSVFAENRIIKAIELDFPDLRYDFDSMDEIADIAYQFRQEMVDCYDDDLIWVDEFDYDRAGEGTLLMVDDEEDFILLVWDGYDMKLFSGEGEFCLDAFGIDIANMIFRRDTPDRPVESRDDNRGRETDVDGWDNIHFGDSESSINHEINGPHWDFPGYDGIRVNLFIWNQDYSTPAGSTNMETTAITVNREVECFYLDFKDLDRDFDNLGDVSDFVREVRQDLLDIYDESIVDTDDFEWGRGNDVSFEGDLYFVDSDGDSIGLLWDGYELNIIICTEDFLRRVGNN